MLKDVIYDYYIKKYGEVLTKYCILDVMRENDSIKEIERILKETYEEEVNHNKIMGYK